MAAPAAAGSWRPSLKFFLLRSQSIGLYRRLLRAARGAPDPGTRDAIREQIRASYEANRGVRDEELMRHLLEDAKKSLKKLEEMVGMRAPPAATPAQLQLNSEACRRAR